MAKDKKKDAETEIENITEEAGTEETEKNEEVSEQEENELEKKVKDVTEKYMRTLAEYDNYRKRTIKEKESIYPEAKAVVVEKFLPVLDNLERALSSAENKDAFYDGIEAIRKQTEEVLAAIGVEKIESVGKEFDPMLHNAVMHIDDEKSGENIIVEEFQKGYRIGDRIVRHSMVKVAN